MNRERALALALAAPLMACGYRAVYGGDATAERLHVVLARSVVADSIAAGEVASGLREELAREGALAGGDGYPRVEVEVTRIDESSEAIAAGKGTGGARAPTARGLDVGVVARAWLVRSTGAAHERDTGDLRVLVDTSAGVVGTSTSAAPAAAFQHDDAVRAAARLTGHRLAQRILGEPSPGVDFADDPQHRGP